jgi:plasmid maintenance system antidote protein VapI
MSLIPPISERFLREEFIKPLELAANALALALRVPATRIGGTLRSERPLAILADTAVRLARYCAALAEHGLAIERDVHPRAELAASVPADR